MHTIHLGPFHRRALTQSQTVCYLYQARIPWRALSSLPDLEHSWSPKTINLSWAAAGAEAAVQQVLSYSPLHTSIPFYCRRVYRQVKAYTEQIGRPDLCTFARVLHALRWEAMWKFNNRCELQLPTSTEARPGEKQQVDPDMQDVSALSHSCALS